jgi:hypothetical protein
MSAIPVPSPSFEIGKIRTQIQSTQIFSVKIETGRMDTHGYGFY